MKALTIIMQRNQRKHLNRQNADGRFIQLFCRIAAMALFFCLSGCGGGGGSADLNNTDPITNDPVTGTSKATLSWEAPATYKDGSPLSDLAGFKVYVGTVSPISKENSQEIYAGNTTTYTIEGLASGTYYFAVIAYNSAGNESELSNAVSKIITGT